MTAISNEIRARIIGMSEGGSTGVHITAIVGLSVRTIEMLVKKFREDGTYKYKPCSGSHTKKLNNIDVRSILRYSKNHCRSSISKITSICPSQVRRRTIQRLLRRSGIFS